MDKPRIYGMSFASVYPLYITKVERKGQSKADLDKLILWLTGYSSAELKSHIKAETNFEDFFNSATKLNSDRKLITGVICGVRVEEIKEPIMQEIRYLDKIVDELANGKAMEKIMRSAADPEPSKAKK